MKKDGICTFESGCFEPGWFETEDAAKEANESKFELLQQVFMIMNRIVEDTAVFN